MLRKLRARSNVLSDPGIPTVTERSWTMAPAVLRAMDKIGIGEALGFETLREMDAATGGIAEQPSLVLRAALDPGCFEEFDVLLPTDCDVHDHARRGFAKEQDFLHTHGRGVQSRGANLLLQAANIFQERQPQSDRPNAKICRLPLDRFPSAGDLRQTRSADAADLGADPGDAQQLGDRNIGALPIAAQVRGS